MSFPVHTSYANKYRRRQLALAIVCWAGYFAAIVATCKLCGCQYRGTVDVEAAKGDASISAHGESQGQPSPIGTVQPGTDSH